ncbi:MAG: hypothetical protein Fur002_00890 [Anaerolineales bacterium]
MTENHPKILIVDDDEIARAAIEALLADEPYDLYFAANGYEGISMAVSLHPDLILLDVMMPNMDGFEACQKIREFSDTAEIPVMMITALDDNESRERGVRAGANDFVSKPYDKADLFQKITALLHHPSRRAK